jgi:hypothetical protein
METLNPPAVSEDTSPAINGTASVAANGTPAATHAVFSAPPVQAAPPAIADPSLYTLTPASAWPPPIYVHPGASYQERYYMEHRWHSQWSYYDKKASEAKRLHQRFQIISAVGSVAVPPLIGLNAIGSQVQTAMTVLTILVSSLVAAASAVENVKKYGDNWRSYRSAAEELLREKSLYDVYSGPYRKSDKPFLLFVERCEDVIAKQNGNWVGLKEEQPPTSPRGPQGTTAEDGLG